MRRRGVLRALGAVGAASLAGCLDRGRSALGPRPHVSTLGSDDTRPDLMWLFDRLGVETAQEGDPVELVGVGSGDGHHWVTVAAESDAPVETSFAVKPAGGEDLYGATVELSNVAYLGVRFAVPQRYEVGVSSETASRRSRSRRTGSTATSRTWPSSSRRTAPSGPAVARQIWRVDRRSAPTRPRSARARSIPPALKSDPRATSRRR